MGTMIEQFITEAPFFAVLLVFWAGALASLASCTIIRVPVALSYVAGAADSKKKALLVTALFGLGLVLSYTLFGVLLGLVGNFAFTFFRANKYIFWGFGGALIICGMFVSGLLSAKWLSRWLDVKKDFGHMSYVGAFVFGTFFALLEMPTCPCCGGVLLLIAGLVVTHDLSAYAVLIFVAFALGQSFPVMAIALSTSLVKGDLLVKIAPRVHRLEERVKLVAGNILMTLGIYFCVVA